MTQKQKAQSGFTVIGDGKQKLAELQQKRQSLRQDVYQAQRQESGSLEERTQQLTKLDGTIEKFHTYTGDIADLTAGLTGGLEGYVQFVKDSTNFKGFEKVLSIMPFAHQKAERMRRSRIRTQNPGDNLKQILSHGEQLYEEVVALRDDAITTFDSLVTQRDAVVAKIEETEPVQAALKERKDAMEQRYAELKAQANTASAAEQAVLYVQINTLSKELLGVRDQYDQTFTKYNQAKQALESNVKTADAFEQMVRDLGRQATMIKEKIENVTEIYAAAPEAVKIMMTTKGVEKLDQTINVATEMSVDMIVDSAAAVMDATLKREEIELVDEAKMGEVIQKWSAAEQDFTQRYDAIRQRAHRSREERYGA